MQAAVGETLRKKSGAFRFFREPFSRKVVLPVPPPVVSPPPLITNKAPAKCRGFSFVPAFIATSLRRRLGPQNCPGVLPQPIGNNGDAGPIA